MILAVGSDVATSGFPWSASLIGVALLIANGVFVAAEISLLAARRTRVEDAADAGDRRARRALKALNEVSVTYSGAQLGITMCSLGLGAIAAPAMIAWLREVFDGGAVPAGATPALSVVIALAVLMFLHMVIGEMLPKHLSLARAEPVAYALSRPFALFLALFRPLILLPNGLAGLLVRLVRVEPVDEHQLVHTPDELSLVLAESRESGTIAPQDARVMGAALRLATIDAEAAMTPRVDMHAVDDTATLAEVLAVAEQTGHTRIPVFRGDIDHIVGLVHVKDVLVRDDDDFAAATAADLLRPLPAVPESRDLERLLRDMLNGRNHALLVVDEFGGTAGILTLEDVLEELVGEIDDEFDEAGTSRRASDRVWMVPGNLRRDEVQRSTGVVLEAGDGDAETVSGWMVEQLGRLPQVGDRVLNQAGWLLVVRSLEGRRAGDVEVRAPESVTDGWRGGTADGERSGT